MRQHEIKVHRRLNMDWSIPRWQGRPPEVNVSLLVRRARAFEVLITVKEQPEAFRAEPPVPLVS
jgi:hypothetical protein